MSGAVGETIFDHFIFQPIKNSERNNKESISNCRKSLL